MAPASPIAALALAASIALVVTLTTNTAHAVDRIVSHDDLVAYEGREPPRYVVPYVFAASLGAALPFGSFLQSPKLSLSDVTTVQGFARVDVGLRPTRALQIGGFFRIAGGGSGPAFRSECEPSEAGCFVGDLQTGIELQLHPLRGDWTDFWFAYGVGYEYAQVGARRDVNSFSLSAEGFVLADTRIGINLRIATSIELGPYVAYSLGRFNSTHVETTGDFPDPLARQQSATRNLSTGDFHHWLGFGFQLSAP